MLSGGVLSLSLGYQKLDHFLTFDGSRTPTRPSCPLFMALVTLGCGADAAEGMQDFGEADEAW